jgi:hypothetical protein
MESSPLGKRVLMLLLTLGLLGGLTVVFTRSQGPSGSGPLL